MQKGCFSNDGVRRAVTKFDLAIKKGKVNQESSFEQTMMSQMLQNKFRGNRSTDTG